MVRAGQDQDKGMQGNACRNRQGKTRQGRAGVWEGTEGVQNRTGVRWRGDVRE